MDNPALVRWEKVTLIGVGLLGGSLGLALRRRQLARHVVGLVRRETARTDCLAAGAVDHATLDPVEAVRDADLVVLGTPLGEMVEIVRRIHPALPPHALVTDVGSVKAPLIRQLEPLFNHDGPRFVGSHPMAGSEFSGVAHARADLFERAVCVVTPTARSHPAAIDQVEILWRAVGGVVRRMSPEDHDDAVSRSSHLPHLLAAALVHEVLGPDTAPDQEALCASGFRDCTRVASGSAPMWRDIASMNHHRLRHAVASLSRRLTALEALLEQPDAGALEAFFHEARHRRERWLERPASGFPPTPGSE